MSTQPVPYDFQEEIDIKVRVAMMEKHRHIIIQSPTGSGKTVMFAKNVYDADKKGTTCLIITDRIELLTGTDGTLEKFGIKTQKILKGQKLPPSTHKHCIAMSQTLRRRIGMKEWDLFFKSFGLIIIDEAHVQEFNIYFENDAFGNNPFILGYTATPIRLRKQRELILDYSYLIEGPQIPDLIKRGFLVPDRYYAPRHFDVNSLSLNTFGDYKEDEMFKKFEQTVSYSSVIENWTKYANNTITIVFCVNIEHTLNTCMAFNEAGIKSKFIVSPLSKPKFEAECSNEQFVRYKEKKVLYEKYEACMAQFSGERDSIIEQWKSRKFDVLINTGIFTKGFDYKQIETVMTLRATTSEALWLQMIGRGSRIYPGKMFFNILDFGSNAERLGLYNQERQFSLQHSKSKSDGIAPVKECGCIRGKKVKDKNNLDGCGCLILASRKVCTYCGYVFEQEKIEIDVNLVYIEYNEDKYDKSKFNKIDFARLDRTMEERGYKFAWVLNQIIAAGGLEALEAYSEYKQYKNGWIYSVEKRYDEAIRKYNEKNLLKLPPQDIEKQLLF